jgi:glycosyltransferase involved in cell wall biosynthesis
MKIAHVVASLPPDIGGMGRVAFDEAYASAANGHDVTVFTLSYYPHSYNDINLPFKVIRARPLLRSGIAGLVPDWRNAFKKFDLIHLHYPFYGGAEWVWMSGKNYVVTYHMDAAPTLKHRQLVKNVYDRLFARRILQKAKRVILVDERHYLADRKFLFPDQSLVIHNGINTDVFKPTVARVEDLGLDEAKNKILYMFVGNLLPVKGLSKLLKAWKKALRSDIHLAVVGGGYHEHELRLEAEQHNIKNITWLGACHDLDKMAKLYSVADCVVVPSLSESFSLVTTEALSCSTPVLSSSLPGMFEKVIDDKTGFTFDPGNEEQMINAINKFANISEEKRKEMGENGRKLVLEKYSMAVHMKKLELLYKEVI